MDTDAQFAQLPERDHSPEPVEGEEQGSRSVHVRGFSPLRALREWATGGGPLRRFVLLLACCMVFVLLVSSYLVQPFLIPSGSMENTLRIGDRVLVNKLAYRFGDTPRRGDVIVFDGTDSFVQDPPAENPVTAVIRKAGSSVGLMTPAGTDYVKRVVGIGGDRVTCCDKRGLLQVNGHPVLEDGYLHPGDAPSRVPFDIVVPEGKLWVMGDHRDDSRDSRDHLGEPGGGTVPVGRVIGRADWIGWPFGRIRSLPGTGAFEGVPAPGPGTAHGGRPHG